VAKGIQINSEIWGYVMFLNQYISKESIMKKKKVFSAIVFLSCMNAMTMEHSIQKITSSLESNLRSVEKKLDMLIEIPKDDGAAVSRYEFSALMAAVQLQTHVATQNVREVECMQAQFREEMETFKRGIIDIFAEKYLPTIGKQTEKLLEYEQKMLAYEDKIVAQDQKIAQLEEKELRIQALEAYMRYGKTHPSIGYPDPSKKKNIDWGVEHTAEENGWIYAEARSYNSAEPCLTIDGSIYRIVCAVSHTYATIFVPIFAGSKYKAANGDYTSLIFYGCLEIKE
jgi:hypothetical protein